jgi:asparagine synthase (glutamine-hydrolysing)
MAGVIRHRGPDEFGMYVDKHIGLGSVRLSIIDLSTGTQPISNEDQSLWIVYNGETFNYIELKEELVNKGHRFTTDTDTEVVLHLYMEYGARCVERMNGQFAFAIWDRKNKELFMARDRVGIRPLFYCTAKGKFVFGSEVKAIFMEPSIDRQIDLEALSQVFTLWTTLPGKTNFNNVSELRPGHCLTVKDGKISERSYWSYPSHRLDESAPFSLVEMQEKLSDLLLDAVRVRLRADVPVGAYLSGGLDSSITTALIAKNFNNRLKTFSVGFEIDGFDESAHQISMVEHLGTDHSQTLATNKSIRDHFKDVIWHSEKPLLRTAPVPLFLLSRLVRDNRLKVVLTGEGADEMFGGYNIFKEAKIRQFWSRHPDSKLRPRLLERLYPYIFKNPGRSRSFLQGFYAVKPGDLEDPLFSHRVRWRNTGKTSQFFSDPVRDALSDYSPSDELEALLPGDFRSRDLMSKAQYLETTLFLSNYLLSSQGDRVAMGNSLEIRLPFLDHRVIDFAAGLPARWKINGLNEKYILKQAFNGLIPDSIKKRPKQAYRAPIREVFFQKPASEFIDYVVSDEYLDKVGLFDSRKVGKLFDRHRHGQVTVDNEVQNMAVCGIISTQLLYYQFVENFPWKPVPKLKPDKFLRFDSQLF